jgi:hypothetical protein
MTPRKFSVLFAGMPYGGNGGSSQESPNVGEWLIETMLKASKDPRIEHASYTFVSDTPATLSRNRLLRTAVEEGYDFLVFIDSDMYPDVEIAESKDPTAKPFWDSSWEFVMNHYDKGPCLIAAPYCGPPTWEENIYMFRWRDRIRDNPQPDYQLEQFTRFEAAQRSGIEPVAALPTGLMIIDTRVTQYIKPPWFTYEYTDEYESKKASTEDVVFTRDVSITISNALGYNPCYCNWDSWAGHWKPKVVRKPRIVTAESVADIMQKAYHAGGSVDETTHFVQRDPKLKSSSPPVRVEAKPESTHEVAERVMEVQRIPSVLDYVWHHAIKPTDFVVEVGPGDRPFERANAYVDWAFCRGNGNQWREPPDGFTECDVSTQPLPFKDGEVDFLYCRHVLEDLENPEFFLKEVRRVARGGYIETPSPVVEMTRGIDAEEPPYRGYHHHHSIVWVDPDGVLNLVPKMPSVEHMHFDYKQPVLEMADNVFLCNTYHVWHGELTWKYHRPHRDFHARGEYQPLIERAIVEGIAGSKRFVEESNLAIA